MPRVRRAVLLLLLCLTSAAFAVPAAVPQQANGHFDELGVWVPDEPPAVTFLPGADLGAYRNHSEMAAWTAAFAASSPGHVDRFSIGQSVRGLELWTLRITDQSVPGPKPRVLIDAAHHGDEVIGTEIALRLAQDLVEQRGTDPLVAKLLRDYETWIVPMVNPDGVTNIPQASHYATARKNANSVDPNRNYAYQWGGPGSGGPGSDTYRGPSAFSEPETQAIRDLLDGQDFLMYVSIHSGASLILWPWGWTTTDHHERAAYDELGDQLTSLSSGVPNGQTSQILYTASGVSMDHGAGGLDKLRPFSFSPETYQGSGNAFDWWFLFNPPDHQIQSTYLRWKPALLRMIEAAPEYTAASLSSPDRSVNGESFVLGAHLEAPGKRGFRNATAVVYAPPEVEVFTVPAVGLGDVLQGQTRDPTWILQANANGTFQVAVRALSGEAAGNLTRLVTIEARDVVKYVRLDRPTMGAMEPNAVHLWLGGFDGLTGVTGTLRLVADGVTSVDETVAVPDGGSVQRLLPFFSGDSPAGRRVLVLTYDLTAQGPGGPVARHIEQRAAYTVLRPDFEVQWSLPATGKVGTTYTVRATLRNTGNLATDDLEASVTIPAGYVPNRGTTGLPGAEAPLAPFASPAPDLAVPQADGSLRLVWSGRTVAAGGSFQATLRLTAALPGTHAFEAAADYSAVAAVEPPPSIAPLHDEGGATQVVT